MSGASAGMHCKLQIKSSMAQSGALTEPQRHDDESVSHPTEPEETKESIAKGPRSQAWGHALSVTPAVEFCPYHPFSYARYQPSGASIHVVRYRATPWITPKTQRTIP
jgi:hypothetical protein